MPLIFGQSVRRCHTPLRVCEEEPASAKRALSFATALILSAPWMAWNGTALLLCATASVVVKVPVLGGTQGYIYTGVGALMLKLTLAMAALAFTVAKKYRPLFFVGFASVAAAPALRFYATTTLSKVRATMEAEILADNPPPEGFGELLTMHPVQFLFGGVLLILAGILLILAAVLRNR